MSFVHLHGHSTYSFLESIGRPQQIIDTAKDLGMDSIAITDYNGMYGIAKFYMSAKDTDIKPIMGIGLNFVLDKDTMRKIDDIGYISLLAKNNSGYHSLMELTSYANTKGAQDKPKIDLDALKISPTGIIAFMGGEHSRIGKMIQRKEAKDKIIDILNILKDTIGAENVYGEIIAQDYTILPELKEINDKMIEIAQEANIKCIVNNNFHYPKAENKEARETALAIKDNKKMYDADRRSPKGAYHIMSGQEIRHVLSKNGYSEEQINTRMQTNSDIAESIESDIEMGQSLFPNYETPQGIKEIYEENKNNLVIDE